MSSIESRAGAVVEVVHVEHGGSHDLVSMNLNVGPYNQACSQLLYHYFAMFFLKKYSKIINLDPVSISWKNSRLPLSH